MKSLAAPIRYISLTALAWLSLGAASALAAPAVSIVSPAAPAPGDVVTFKATGSPYAQTNWYWNYDARCRTVNGSGQSVPCATNKWVAGGDQVAPDPTPFTERRTYSILACAQNKAKTDQFTCSAELVMQVASQPRSSFSIDPAAPTTGQTVTFTDTTPAPDGTGQIVSRAWTIDGQPAGGDPTASTQFGSAGEHTVSLKVVDEVGNASTHSETFIVNATPGSPTTGDGGTGNGGEPGAGFDTPPATTAPPVLVPTAGLRVFEPAPFIRIKGHTTGKGAQIDLFSVRAARGARVWVRCVGKKCPKHKTQVKAVNTKKKTATVRFRRIEGWFHAGTILEVRVSKKGYIGRYTRFRIGKLKPPVRWDGCLVPGANGPKDC